MLDAVLHRPTSLLCFFSLLLTDMERFVLSRRPILHGKEEDLPGCLSFLLGKRMKSLSVPFLRVKSGCVEEYVPKPAILSLLFMSSSNSDVEVDWWC